MAQASFLDRNPYASCIIWKATPSCTCGEALHLGLPTAATSTEYSQGDGKEIYFPFCGVLRSTSRFNNQEASCSETSKV